MQRRLTIALVLTALISLLLVGFGVLAIAQGGARNRAEDQVTRSLSVVGSLLGSDARQLRQLDELIPPNRRALQLDQLSAVQIGDDGSIRAIVRRGRGQSAAGAVLSERRLSTDELATLDTGETVLVSEPNAVIGLRTLPDSESVTADARLGLLARQEVTALPRQTVVWFLASSLVVIVGASIAGLLLARRLVRPIHQIQGATAAIAAGQLTTRVEVDGDDELAELARSVNRMAADLERSKALDQQFLLSVSHDLRTPLTAISGYAEALRDGAVSNPQGAGEIIGNHADRLDRLVGDLLDLAKLDANRFRLDLRPVDLAVVSGRTVAGLAAEAANHGVTVEHKADASPTVLADTDRMAQVVGNLVENAISFARERVVVTVSTQPSSDPGAGPAQWATITVVDDGPGFSPEDLPFVFDRLYIGRDRPRRAETPTGLGLAIVRELSGAMGGTVSASNGATGGAALGLFFPIVEPGSIPPDPVTTAAQPPRPTTPDSLPPEPSTWPAPRPPA